MGVCEKKVVLLRPQIKMIVSPLKISTGGGCTTIALSGLLYTESPRKNEECVCGLIIFYFLCTFPVCTPHQQRDFVREKLSFYSAGVIYHLSFSRCVVLTVIRIWQYTVDRRTRSEEMVYILYERNPNKDTEYEKQAEDEQIDLRSCFGFGIWYLASVMSQ